jgi:uncharacterized membrane protein
MAATTLTLHHVLTQLGVASDEQNQMATALQTQSEDTATPWYLQIFVALGAWLAAIFLVIAALAFLFLMNLREPRAIEYALIVLGLLGIATALGIRYAAGESVFLAHLALALSIAGQGLFITGVGLISSNVTTTIIVTLVVESLLIAIYPDAIHRFLSTLAIPAALLVLLSQHGWYEAIHLLVIALASGTLYLWLNESRFVAASRRLEAFTHPIAYTLPVALWGTLSLSVVRGINPWALSFWWISAVALWLWLCLLIYRTLHQFGLSSRRGLVISLLLGVTLATAPTLQAPGILAALLVMVLGFQCGNRTLTGLAVVLLAVFIIAFYYNLSITLLWKSLTLMATGVLCLVLRYVVVRFIKVGNLRSSQEAIQ